MQEINNSYQILYKQALVNPSKLSETDLLELIMRYPYSQPLIFAYEYRKKLFDEELTSKSMALLYASSSNWLWTYLNRPNFAEVAVESTEDVNVYNSIEEVEHIDDVRVEETLQESVVVEDVESVNNDSLELDLLVNQGAYSADYLGYDLVSNNTTIEEPIRKEEVNSDDLEDVSLYHDDLLPYSFRWWLYKTRLNHADNYQPFASVKLPKPQPKQIDFGKLDEAVLEQQIKQNIIHFQDPEAKLSDQVKNRPIEPTAPKRTDTIIDRFIKEEPIIQPPLAEKLNTENMARQSAEDNYVLVTETLANIYIEQGLIQKSIEVFKKLILKFPEKKSYFATRIEELEKNL